MSPLSLQSPAQVSPLQKRYLAAYGLQFDRIHSDVSYRSGQLQSGKYALSCQYWSFPAAKGTVLLVHGYFDHVGLYGHIIRFFLQQGLAVFAFDLPGHGLSSGKAASIDCFSRYSDALQTCWQWGEKQQLPTPWLLVGQSTGGAIITDYLARTSPHKKTGRLKQVILLAPLVRPHRWRAGRLLYLSLRHFVRQVPRRQSRNSHDRTFLQFLANDPLQSWSQPVDWVGALNRWIRRIEKVKTACPVPVLIIQGEKDSTVDWKHNMAVFKRLYQSCEILYLPKGQHHLANERADIRQTYMDWLAERLLPKKLKM